MDSGQLFINIQTIHRINCGCCANSLELPTHTFGKIGAAEGMYNLGWRVVDKVVYCPACIVPELKAWDALSDEALANSLSALTAEGTGNDGV